MMLQSEITISGHDALTFRSMLEDPEGLALKKRDEFISDVNIEVQPNGEIIINCDCDFNEINQHTEICNVFSNMKEENLYDTTSINVESSNKYSVAISRLISNTWSDSKYTYEERCKYVSRRDEKRGMYISDILALAS